MSQYFSYFKISKYLVILTKICHNEKKQIMTAPIGPNSSKAIFQGIDKTQEKINPPFGTTLSKLSTTFRDFGQKVKPPSLVDSMNISSISPIKGAIPGLGLNTKGQGR